MNQLGKSLSKDELPWRPGDGKKRVFSSKWLPLLITAPSGNVKFQSCLKENHLFFICLLICWRNLFKTGLPQSKLDDKCVLQSAHQSSSNKIRIIHAKIFIMFQNILIYILNHTLDNMKYLSFGQVWTRKQMHSLNMEQFGKLKEKKTPKNSLVEVFQPLLTYLKKYGHGSNYSVFWDCHLEAVKVIWIIEENLHLQNS